MSIQRDNEKPLRVIFDNAGGATVQINGGEYACRFGNGEGAACTVITYMIDRCVEGWEGHEPAAAELSPTAAEIASGGYRGATEADILAICEKDENKDFRLTYEEACNLIKGDGWYNIREFVEALRRLA